MSRQEIDHEFTDEVVCPYCGQEESDSWEFSDSGSQKCSGCDKEFIFTRNVSVSYSTEKLCTCKHSQGWHRYSDGEHSGVCRKTIYRTKFEEKEKKCECKAFKSL